MTIPTGSSRTTSRPCCAKATSRTWSSGRPGLKISAVIPAHNEEGSITETIDGLVEALEGARIDYEILVVDDSSTDRTRAVVQHIGAENARVRYHASHLPRGFGFTVRSGLDEFEGDAVAIVMADASDDPADLVRYLQLLEEGYDCAFGSRSCAAAPSTTIHASSSSSTGWRTASSACSSATATTTRRTLSRRIAAK